MTDVLEFPHAHVPYVDREWPLRCKPGVFAAELYPAREEGKNGVLLPGNGRGWGSEGAAAERMRPDCVIVQAVGPKPDDSYKPRKMWRPVADYDREQLRSWEQVRQSSIDLAESLLPGDRVMVRPWGGAKYPEMFGVEGVCFYGQTDLWEEDAVLRWVPDEGWPCPAQLCAGIHEGIGPGSWRPLTNWVVLKLDRVTDSSFILSSASIFDVTATVLDAGPLASVRPGQRVVASDDMATQSDDDRKWLTTKWGNWSEDVWLVREVCQDGRRRIVASMD